MPITTYAFQGNPGTCHLKRKLRLRSHWSNLEHLSWDFVYIKPLMKLAKSSYRGWSCKRTYLCVCLGVRICLLFISQIWKDLINYVLLKEQILYNLNSCNIKHSLERHYLFIFPQSEEETIYYSELSKRCFFFILHNFSYLWQRKNLLSCDGCSLFPTKACHC